ncbi:MAG TPA: histidine phosphatase family protein [bacterium]|nr:histidine phosphatase family protein [bacterium]
MPTTLYVIRHGITEWNAAHRLAGRLPGVPLSDDGRREASAVSARLAAVPLAAVVSSPIARARETAELIARPHGLTVVSDDAFTEREYAAWQGLFSTEIHARFPDDARALARGEPVTGVESVRAMAERVWDGMERLVLAHPDAAVAIVSHADPIRALITRVIGMPASRLRAVTIDTASVTRIRRRAQRAVVDYANSRTHLEGAGACGWPPAAARGVV